MLAKDKIKIYSSFISYNSINLFLIIPVLKSQIFTTEQLGVKDYRAQVIFKYKTDNWRYISTLAVISDVINNQPILGEAIRRMKIIFQAYVTSTF